MPQNLMAHPLGRNENRKKFRIQWIRATNTRLRVFQNSAASTNQTKKTKIRYGTLA